MRITFYCIFLLSILLLLKVTAYSQSLGDPVIIETFGSGSNPGAPLPSTVTNYTYTSDLCPGDGFYTIANASYLNSSSGCFTNTWHLLTNDHTGNTNGFMMVVNAANSAGLFYTQRADASKLCGSTTYEFSAWIMNLVLPSACSNNSTRPNITFSIETVSGQVLQTYQTGNILPTNTPEWKQYAVRFTTPANVTDVVVKMVNNAPGGCGNDLALDDITFRAVGPILQTIFATTSTKTESLCQGQSASYVVNTTVSSGNYSFQWQRSMNNGSWADITGETSKNINIPFVNAAIGTYQYRLAVSEVGNINSFSCRTYSDVLTITVNANPVAQVAPSYAVCLGDDLQLTATGGASYKWTGPNGFTSADQNPVINSASTANAGTYTVTVTSAQGCQDIAQTQVQINPIPAGTVSGDVTICENESTVLAASGGVRYSWLPATGLSDATASAPVANPIQTTTYAVRIFNANGCYDTKTVKVTVLAKPTADAGADKKIFEGQSVQLSGTAQGNQLTYLWTPSTYLDNPHSLSPVAKPTEDITYTLKVITANGCGESTDQVFVRVYKEVVVPNTFSPNGDGMNDTWRIEALETYPDCSLAVYNRYGQLVYQSRGYSKEWNGTFNGEAIPAGTYYYIIDLRNKTPLIKGWVMIAR